MSVANTPTAPVDSRRTMLLNNHRSGLARKGRVLRPSRHLDALTLYRDQLRAELAGIERELAGLAAPPTAAVP